MNNRDQIIQDIKVAKRSDYLQVAKKFKESLNRFSTEEIKEVDKHIAEYLKKAFGKEIEHYFRKMYKDNHFLINGSIWSFLARKSFQRFSSNVGNDLTILEKQEKGLSYLIGAAKYYSTIDEFVASGIQSAFYFDRKEEHPGEMIIHEIDVNTKEVLKEIEINGKHRAKLYPLNRFSFTSLEEYKRARKGGVIDDKKLSELEEAQEIAYQNQVIRWYIRIGLFNPLDVKVYAPNASRNLGNKTKNLLIEGQRKVDLDYPIKVFQQTLEAQFHSSIKEEKGRKGYTTTQDDALDKVIAYLFEAFPDHIAARIYTFDTGFFDLSQDDNHISHIYWVPLLTGKKNKPTGGVQYINTDQPLHDKDVKDDLLYTTSILTHLFSGQFDDSQMKEIDYINEKTTANSAGVSIMSRNISHNIGSHAISYEKNALMTWRSMLDNGVLEGLVYKKKGLDGKDEFHFKKNLIKALGDGAYKLDLKKIGELTEFQFIYLEAVGFFLAYLQERIDYTSAVASGTGFYYGKVHLVNDILLHFLRGNKFNETKANIDEWQVNPKNRNILLERIVLSEDYHKEDIVIEYLDKKHLDVVVSLPTGVTGRQGIFAMLENIIRNTAKHGVSKKERKNKIKISIGVEDHNDDYYKLSIIDNSGGALREDKLAEIQESIKGSLMAGDSINERQKGIKEIQIAAAWLRGIEPRDIEEQQKDENQPILKVDAYPNLEKVAGLRFQFFIKKAKEVLLVCREGLKELDLPSSWRAVAYSDLPSIVHGTQYNFVLFDKSSSESLLERAKKEGIPLPIRHLEYDFATIDFKELNDLAQRTEVEAAIYATWLDTMDAKNHDNINKGKKTEELTIGIIDRNTGNLKYPKHIRMATSNDGFEDYLEDGGEAIDIIYQKHNDLKSFKSDYGDLYKNAILIESITGNNSTNRLLREDEKTNYWCRKVQESAACSVMIIDERIWKETIRPKEDDTGFYADLDLEYNKAIKKRIYIYTIRGGENSEEMELVNLKNEVEAVLRRDGIIHWKTEMVLRFHFVSFHQGLLDKIYNYFKITDRTTTEKEIFFNKMKNSTQGRLMYYLHSGRSFTPELPKGTGFIPLSSLDVAMRDCKLLLTDLLFSGALVKTKEDGE